MNNCKNIVIIGSSAGGPRILEKIFSGIPKLNAGVVLIQHMPKFINESLKHHLALVTEMEVRIAENGDLLESGKVVIAPSEKHLTLKDNQYINLIAGEKVNFVCPSIDVAMCSAIINSKHFLAV